MIISVELLSIQNISAILVVLNHGVPEPANTQKQYAIEHRDGVLEQYFKP